MGQVPGVYGIVGRGRVARHFSRYFQLENIPFKTWHRGSAEKAEDALFGADPVLILISDSEIEKFIDSNPWLKQKNLIHFSGSMRTPLARGFHPLMTFGQDDYDLETYRKIPFVVEDGGPGFGEIFPSLKNPSFELAPDKKAFYHALCVLSGNFTAILWNKFFNALEKDLGLPRAAAFAYLDRVAANLKRDSARALTGPLQRRDRQTIEKNLEALEGDPFRKIYESFADLVLKPNHRGGAEIPAPKDMKT